MQQHLQKKRTILYFLREPMRFGILGLSTNQKAAFGTCHPPFLLSSSNYHRYFEVGRVSRVALSALVNWRGKSTQQALIVCEIPIKFNAN